MIVGFHRPSEGSVLYRAGGTVVLCTASVDEKVPAFLEGKNQGWVTAEYQMHPRANPRRQDRDGRGKAPGGRTQEIQRLVGRALRGAVNLERLGTRTVTIDCDVLEADGGTRTASVTGGFVALALALSKVGARAIREGVAAISVGYVDGVGHALDLCYVEDSRARVDLNVVATTSGRIVEVQGTAEGEPVERREIDGMVDLALVGIARLVRSQRDVLARAGVALDAISVKGFDGAGGRSPMTARYEDTLVVATTNRGKLEELRQLLAGLPVAVRAAGDVMRDPPEVVEDGATFQDNALKKATEIAHATMMLTLADDSGPRGRRARRPAYGVRSARFGSSARHRRGEQRRAAVGDRRARRTRRAGGLHGLPRAVPLRPRPGGPLHRGAARADRGGRMRRHGHADAARLGRLRL